MNEQDYIVRELFAYFGRIMYLAQTVEKGMMNIVLFSQHENGITRSRYDEILEELASLTFGQLKRKLIELDIFNAEEIQQIEEFHKKRDFLAHSYWWERTVEFYDESLQHKLLTELDGFTNFFESINELVWSKYEEFDFINEIDLEKEKLDLISQGKTIPLEEFRKLDKNEIVVNIFGYKNAPSSLIPIFELKDNSFWTICEIGLTQYTFKILESNKTSLKKLEGIFPINQFNPRPKINQPWNYELDLKKKGLKMKISKENSTSPMKWGIDK
jgi:hypothetical protein